jgi:hypothetical protein
VTSAVRSPPRLTGGSGAPLRVPEARRSIAAISVSQNVQLEAQTPPPRSFSKQRRPHLGPALPGLSTGSRPKDLTSYAILMNLWRIQNALGDLYTTTMHQLTPAKIRDASYEFIHYYFVINVVVIVIALGVINRPPHRTANGVHPGSDRPQMTDPQ